MLNHLYFILDQRKYNALSGLAYRIADNAYMIERYGADGSAIEREQNHATICGLFADLDAMRVPFWVQNSVIAFAEDWRRYKETSLASWLENRNIDCSFVSCR